MHLVKVDLKDTYLTVPVAKGSRPLPAFQNQGRSLSVQGPTIQSLLPVHLHKTYKASSSVCSLSWNPDTHLLG